MPLTTVKDLMRHAAGHGYLVASFKVNGADEVQAVVNAAEAARAPAIIAVEEQGHAALLHDIALVAAKSLAAAASVPIAVELVSRPQRDGPVGSRIDGAAVRASSAVAKASFDEVPNGDDPPHEPGEADRELWFELPEAAAALAEATAAGCRVGVIVADSGPAAQRLATLRRHLKALAARDPGPMVADGDLPWTNGAFRSLPALGAAKINFDTRLAQVMAKANRRAAQRAGDRYRLAVEETIGALKDEVVECLRRAGSSGRAADVLAFEAEDEPECRHAASRESHFERTARRAAELAHVAAAPGSAPRASWFGVKTYVG